MTDSERDGETLSDEQVATLRADWSRVSKSVIHGTAVHAIVSLCHTVDALRKQRDTMVRAADALLAEKILLRDQVQELHDIVHEVAASGVESDLSPRYMVVQIDCATWADVQRAARTSEEADG